MPVVATIGAQWGDEGKGKVVDLLAEKAKMVVRYSGGNNAGHTVINHLGEFKMHLIPCGVFHATPICVIGNGVVVDPLVLLDEIEMITRAGISLEGRLVVSSRAHVIMPYHILLDGLDEEARGEGAIGTTRRGIGPAYSDRISSGTD
jgi:adenylosuccinate synthase